MAEAPTKLRPREISGRRSKPFGRKSIVFSMISCPHLGTHSIFSPPATC